MLVTVTDGFLTSSQLLILNVLKHWDSYTTRSILITKFFSFDYRVIGVNHEGRKLGF